MCPRVIAPVRTRENPHEWTVYSVLIAYVRSDTPVQDTLSCFHFLRSSVVRSRIERPHSVPLYDPTSCRARPLGLPTVV